MTSPAAPNVSPGPLGGPPVERLTVASGWVTVRVAVWLLTTGVLGVALFLSMSNPVPLDDPDPAMQRAGILDVVGPRSRAATVLADIPAPGRRAVVLFVRPPQAIPLVNALNGHPESGCAM